MLSSLLCYRFHWLYLDLKLLMGIFVVWPEMLLHCWLLDLCFHVHICSKAYSLSQPEGGGVTKHHRHIPLYLFTLGFARCRHNVLELAVGVQYIPSGRFGQRNRAAEQWCQQLLSDVIVVVCCISRQRHHGHEGSWRIAGYSLWLQNCHCVLLLALGDCDCCCYCTR